MMVRVTSAVRRDCRCSVRAVRFPQRCDQTRLTRSRSTCSEPDVVRCLDTSWRLVRNTLFGDCLCVILEDDVDFSIEAVLADACRSEDVPVRDLDANRLTGSDTIANYIWWRIAPSQSDAAGSDAGDEELSTCQRQWVVSNQRPERDSNPRTARDRGT